MNGVASRLRGYEHGLFCKRWRADAFELAARVLQVDSLAHASALVATQPGVHVHAAEAQRARSVLPFQSPPAPQWLRYLWTAGIWNRAGQHVNRDLDGTAAAEGNRHASRTEPQPQRYEREGGRYLLHAGLNKAAQFVGQRARQPGWGIGAHGLLHAFLPQFALHAEQQQLTHVKDAEVATISSSTQVSALNVGAVPEPSSIFAVRKGAFMIPHPDKRDKGGEDAFFLSDFSMGVFDGVGGWASLGVDPGLYSQELASKTAQKLREYGPESVARALQEAVHENEHIGSSTACVVSLVEDRLTGVNLGDSAVMVIRGNEVVFRTEEQQHYFNCPYQLGTDSQDSVESADSIDFQLRRGDWIILGTDGLFDNCFTEDIMSEVIRHERRRLLEALDPAYLSESLARMAHSYAMDTRRDTPFAMNARQAGHIFMGGKMDDITVVVCRVDDKQQLKP
ncbi:putative protein phosphatase 2C 80 [Porphyridium purpureum]|uniref:Protein phosphatase n=1 Tax=Porphyridium purpureum TaxID=35688 RepID=A0A5J4YZ17_PORPP|nr:putative protein phosphatase 2C 80 [Porphyridium purpureum]|eukprot:POR1072..scf209_3